MNTSSSNGKSVRKLRERLREATALEILAAAEAVFAERGIHATHIADIAARAGLAVGTLYNHFQDRETLLGALVERRLDDMLDAIDGAQAATAGQQLRAQLLSVLSALLRNFEQHWPFFVAHMQVDPKHMMRLHATKESCHPRDTIRAMYRRFEELVQNGVQQGALRADLAPLMPSLLIGMVRAILVHELYAPQAGKLTDHAAQLVDFFLHGAGV